MSYRASSGSEQTTSSTVINRTAHKNFVSEVKGPRIAKGDYRTSFSMDNLFKDIRLAKRLADKNKANLPVSRLIIDQYSKAVSAGDGKTGF